MKRGKLFDLAAILLGIALVLGTTACSSSEPVGDEVPVAVEPETQETETETTEPESEPEPILPHVHPLTGIPTEMDASAIRPIFVSIENSGRAYPQSGLDQADVVYEMMVEGGITRFLAVYHSSLPSNTVIGPIRSARHDFYDLTREYDAVLVHAGASPQAYALIQARKVKDIDEITMGGPFFRSKDRKMPHNLYTRAADMKQFTVKRGYEDSGLLQSFTFFSKDQGLVGGQPAQTVHISFHSKYKVSYEFSDDNQTYTRYMRGKPHFDNTTGQPLTAVNIVVQFTKYRSIDKEDRQEVAIVGEGEGYIIQNGAYSEIRWKKDSSSDRTKLYSLDGQPVNFKPGNTFWHIVSDSIGKVDWQNPL
jgi:hypothetical protein